MRCIAVIFISRTDAVHIRDNQFSSQNGPESTHSQASNEMSRSVYMFSSCLRQLLVGCRQKEWFNCLWQSTVEGVYLPKN